MTPLENTNKFSVIFVILSLKYFPPALCFLTLNLQENLNYKKILVLFCISRSKQILKILYKELHRES